MTKLPKHLFTTIALSMAAMGVAIFTWPDLFLFSKVLGIPDWAKKMPDPILATWGIVTLCLMPIVLLQLTSKNTIYRISITALLGALLSVFAWCTTHRVGNLENIIFQFAWVFGLSVLPPAIIVGAAYTLFAQGKLGSQPTD
ncbi:MAG: hypothetical protein WBP13_08760 [Methylophilaceae bacterium]